MKAYRDLPGRKQATRKKTARSILYLYSGADPERAGGGGCLGEPPKFRKCTTGNHMHVHVQVSAVQF